jgi:hypothetical protein
LRSLTRKKANRWRKVASLLWNNDDDFIQKLISFEPRFYRCSAWGGLAVDAIEATGENPRLNKP